MLTLTWIGGTKIDSCRRRARVGVANDRERRGPDSSTHAAAVAGRSDGTSTPAGGRTLSVATCCNAVALSRTRIIAPAHLPICPAQQAPSVRRGVPLRQPKE
jgi:hypothetical protein